MSSVAQNTFPASIAVPIQRRGDRIAFAEIEQMLDDTATRHRDLQKEMNRGEAIQRETQRRDTIRRDVTRDTIQRQTQQQQERLAERQTDCEVREPRRSASRSVSVSSSDGVDKNAAAKAASVAACVQNVVTPQSESNSLNAPTFAKFPSASHTSSPLEISPSSPLAPSAAVASATTLGVSTATSGGQPPLSQIATTTPSAVATAFTIFSSRVKLRSVDNDTDDEHDADDDDRVAASEAGTSAAKSDVARRPRGGAIQLFTHLFTSPRVKTSPLRTEDAKQHEPSVGATPSQIAPILPQRTTTPQEDATTTEKASTSTSRQNATVELIQRVVAALQSAANRGDTVRIRMHPESLGSVAVRVRIRDGKMSASLRVESEAARTTLLSHRDALRNRLTERGISLEEFEVEIL